MLIKESKLYLPAIIFLMMFVMVASGCYKFEGTQTIPAYLKIDSVYLQTTYSQQGTSSQEITDVWVFVDDQQIGVFELPALFPVLATGKHKLEIRPGIKLNGISSTRVPYPFYKPIRISDFEFYPDSVQNLNNIKTTYYDKNIDFIWMEDFESPSLSIKETKDSDTTINRTEPADNTEAWLTDDSRYSGVITLTNKQSFFEAMSYNAYKLPKGKPVMLEVNFKTDNYLTVGLFINEPDRYIKSPLVILNYADTWHKIYINFEPTISNYPKAIDFKIYFVAHKRSDKETTHIFLDNIKLIYRAN